MSTDASFHGHSGIVLCIINVGFKRTTKITRNNGLNRQSEEEREEEFYLDVIQPGDKQHLFCTMTSDLDWWWFRVAKFVIKFSPI